jgi:hypothetical protein
LALFLFFFSSLFLGWMVSVSFVNLDGDLNLVASQICFLYIFSLFFFIFMKSIYISICSYPKTKTKSSFFLIYLMIFKRLTFKFSSFVHKSHTRSPSCHTASFFLMLILLYQLILSLNILIPLLICFKGKGKTLFQRLITIIILYIKYF